MLATRVATAAVGIPIIFGLVWIGGWPYAIVAAIALAVAAAEFAHLRERLLHANTFASAAIILIVAILVHVNPSNLSFLGVALIILLVGVAGRITPIRSQDNRLSGRPGWLTSTREASQWIAIGMLYVGGLGSTIVLLRDLDNGRDWVYLALFSTFAVDTSAYFVGRAIGRHKLAPSISPKKTWEGFFGGYAGGIAAVLLLNYFLGLRIDAGPALLIAVTLPLAAALGDLFESWVKRRAGVKDASELIPGHGGVLDRLDSLLFVFPLVYVVARWIE